MRVPKKHPKNHSKNRFSEPFGAHFGLPKPSKIERKTIKNELEKNIKKIILIAPIKKPVIARNGKSEDILELLKHATPSQKM